MKKILIIAMLIVALCLGSVPALASVFINEIAANEGSANFLEFYFNGNQTVDLTGYRVEINGATSGSLFGILSPSDRFITFNQPTLGIILPPGANIILYNAQGIQADAMNASNFASGQSYGRYPDGDSHQELMQLTPDAPNQRLASGNTSNISTNGSMLKITKVKIDGERLSLTGGDTIDEIMPGDNIEIEINIENEFSRSSDIEIENIEIEVTIEDIDDGDDLDFESDDEFDIDAGDDEDVELDFVVPYEVEDNEKYRIVIEAVGEDNNGSLHRDFVTGYIKIEKDEHNVKISDLTVNPKIISCSRNLEVSVRVTNLGEEREKNARLLVSSGTLGISSGYSFSLDEDPFDEEYDIEKDFLFTLPEDVQSGNHELVVRTYYDNSIPSDSRNAEILVRECDETGSSSSEETDAGKGDVTVSMLPKAAEEQDSDFVWGSLEKSLLSAIIILIIGFIVFLVIKGQK